MKLALLLAALVLSTTAVWAAENGTLMEKDPVLAALKDVIAESSTSFTSYRFTLDMDQTMKLFNLTDQTEAPEVILVKSFGAGSLNLTDKAMKIAMANVVMPFGDDDNVTAMALEEYFINDTIYMKIDGNWTMMKLNLPDIWSSQNTAGTQLEILNQSQITLLGVQTIDGQECYQIGVVQDMDALSKVASEQTDLPLGMINLSELYQNATMELVYWIDMDEKQLRKMEMTMDLSMDPEDLGIPADEIGDRELQMFIRSTYLYRDINEDIEIVLPAEALAAQPLSLSLFNETADLAPQNTSTVEQVPSA